MKSIKEYYDYRDFLKDFYYEKKLTSPFFSYRLLGSKIGIDASHLVKIFQKQRHIGTASIETFIAFCGLSGSEAEYFSTLVQFTKSKSERNGKVLFERLLRLKGVRKFALEKKHYEFYTTWYYSAILTLLYFYPFHDDYKALAGKLTPSITEGQARKAVKLLESLGLIARDALGTYRLTNTIITSGDQCRSIAVKTFQEETMRLAMESLYRHAPEKRNISTVTITISESDLPEISELIASFRESLLKFAEEKKDPDRVYQLNIQLYPLTK